jgi:hypothetical protein
MTVYKRSIDFLPQLSKGEKEERFKVSKAGLYAAVLPLLASLIWVISMFINSYYKSELDDVNSVIAQKEGEIENYSSLVESYSELVLKVEALSDVVDKDFYPQKFFDDVARTISSTNDAQAEIYAYGRDEEGVFTISGKANSYLDLAKIMVVFDSKEEFLDVGIKSIRYDEENSNVNFEISFIYAEETEEV